MISKSSHAKIEGSLGYFGLVEWWLIEFTESEREYIETKFKPLSFGGGNNSRPLTEGKIYERTQAASRHLSSLAGWFDNAKDFSLGKRIIQKAVELLGLEGDSEILDHHFVYGQMMKTYYAAREIDASAMEMAIHACEKQIAIAPKAAEAFLVKYPSTALPWHKGYDQLVIILEISGKYDSAIQLCNQAKEQGWAGNWDKRISRCQQKSRGS